MTVVESIVEGLPPQSCLVAVDGVDGSGKSTFASELASEIARTRAVEVVHMDDFLNPAEVRHAKGRDSAEGFWLDSYDYATFHRSVIDRPHESVVVVEGLFLHRDELRNLWDVSVFLDVPFSVSVARMAERDGSHPDPDHPSMQRYVGGQRLYFAARPWDHATWVIDNSGTREPRFIDASEAAVRHEA